MEYKKTYWMNVVITVFALLLAVASFNMHVAEHGYAHLPIFLIGYSCIIASPLLTAIALKKTEWKIVKWTAIALNVGGALLFLHPLYSVFTSTAYMRLAYIGDTALTVIIILIPCLINLKALHNKS